MSNDTDAKEWVTIKIPKAVRDDAQDDPRTYGEIMRAGLDRDSLGDTDAPAPDDFPDINEVLAEVDGSVTYDDVLAACRQAIREELPLEAMGR